MPELARFFRSVVLSVAARNGDAHSKDLGVLHDRATDLVWLAPAFNVVTTTAYVAGDSMALTLDGTKRWPDGKRLQRYGIQPPCQLTAHAARCIITEVVDAVIQVSGKFKSTAANDPTQGNIIERRPSHLKVAAASPRRMEEEFVTGGADL